MASDLMSQDDALRYWEERHKSSSDLRAGGDKGLSDAANELFYALRAGGLLRLIAGRFNLLSPLRILDAGCGRGRFSDLPSRGGFTVTGIDSSSTAIQYCTRNCLGDYVRSTIDSFVANELYDVVYSIDVMFHILDDQTWKNSLLNLCSLVSAGGLLIITDTNLQERWVKGDYIVHRSREEYITVAATTGMRFMDFHPYDFGGNPIGFYLFERV